MAETPPPYLPSDLRASLESAFFIRFTSTGRRSALPRTSETTYVWDGERRLIISGYPGKRDWVANISANPQITVHTVQGDRFYDIPATARVLRSRSERTPPLLAFIEHWATRPEGPRTLFSLLVRSIRLNRGLGLPWWGPFYLVRRVMDRMPCVEVTLAGEPVARSQPPPRPRRGPGS